MKRIVRLTENDIRKMVKEALNELHPFTYHRAANKRMKQYVDQLHQNRVNGTNEVPLGKDGRPKMSSIVDLQQMGNKRLNQMYGDDNSYGEIETIPGLGYQSGYSSHTFNPDISDYNQTNFNYDNSGREDSSGWNESYPMRDAISSYFNGDYEYQKGKGWVNKNEQTLNEAVHRAIMKLTEVDSKHNNQLLEDVDTGQVKSAHERSEESKFRGEKYEKLNKNPQYLKLKKELRRLRNEIEYCVSKDEEEIIKRKIKQIKNKLRRFEK